MRILLSRWVSPFACLSLLFVLAAPSTIAADNVLFSGVVKDTVGNFLEDVEVLVVDKTPSVTPIAAARSNSRGHFSIADLPRGTYRIAALKDGYLTFVGKIDTQLQQWIQLVLHRMPDIDGQLPEPLPADESWVYRVPRRYVLDETDPEPVAAGEDTVHASHARSLRDVVQMQVDQLFSMGASLRADDPSRPDVRGSETRLRVASLIGQRGNIDVQGYRESFASSSESVEQASSASRDAAAVSLAFSYDTSTDAQLDVNAFYNERALEYSTAPTDPASWAAEPFDSTTQAHRRWGYDARWSKQLDAASNLAVKLDYKDTTLSVGDLQSFSPAQEGQSLPGQVFTRSVGASGSYASAPVVDHSVQIDFRAQVLETSEPLSTTAAAVSLAPTYIALSGLSVGIDAQDTWSLTGPFALVYGLGYKHALTSDDSSLIVPRVGGVWSIERLALRFLLSYHTVTDWSSHERPDGMVPFRPADAVGYDAEIDLPLVSGLNLKGGLSYSPIQLDFLGYSGGGSHGEARPIYLTDGNAAVREHRLALVREAGRTQTYVEFTDGDVQGTLAAMSPYEMPIGLLSSRALQYGTGRFGVRILPSGTDVMVQYQRLVQTAIEDPTAGEARQKSVEVRLTQDLLTLRSVGHWRLLMAIRRARLDSEGASDIFLRPSDEAVLEALNHRVSAGVSFTF